MMFLRFPAQRAGKMYPYQYHFTKDDAEAAYESSQIWYYDGLHYPEPHYPFDLIWDEAWYLALSQYNTRHWLIPPAMGIDHRIVNGYVYISPVAVANPDDIPRGFLISWSAPGTISELE